MGYGCNENCGAGAAEPELIRGAVGAKPLATSWRRAGVSCSPMWPVLAALMLVAGSSHADWQNERWVAEAFTDALGGGPSSGPVAQVGGEVTAICGRRDGTRFLVSGQFVDIITPDGIRRRLAGTGVGFK